MAWKTSGIMFTKTSLRYHPGHNDWRIPIDTRKWHQISASHSALTLSDSPGWTTFYETTLTGIFLAVKYNHFLPQHKHKCDVHLKCEEEKKSFSFLLQTQKQGERGSRRNDCEDEKWALRVSPSYKVSTRRSCSVHHRVCQCLWTLTT